MNRTEHGNQQHSKAEKQPQGDLERVDKVIAEMFQIGKGDSLVIEEEPYCTKVLLNTASRYRHEDYGCFTQGMAYELGCSWTDVLDELLEQIMAEAGIHPYATERLETAEDHIVKNYFIKGPTLGSQLDREARVEIILATPAEADCDFLTILDMKMGTDAAERSGSESETSALAWLISQQGHTLDSFREALECCSQTELETCCERFGDFLSTAAAETMFFTEMRGALCVLVRIRIADIPSLFLPAGKVVMPVGSTIGIHAMECGENLLRIQLERPLAIPTEMIYDVVIEGADHEEVTPVQLRSLPERAWKKPVFTSFSEQPIML